MSIIDEKWDFNIDLNEIEKNRACKYELEMSDLCESVVKILEENFIIGNISSRDNFVKSNDDELKVLAEKNKELRQDIEIKIKEIKRQQDQYENYKTDQKLLSQEIKETHEAFLMAKKYYKKYLKTYFSIETRNKETQLVFVQFFTEAKKDSDVYSVHFIRNVKTGNYDLQSVQPKLKKFKEIQKKLYESNDVPGILCCIREAFLTIKGIKK